MSVIISPNMNLTIPVVGQELGPQWASDLNGSLILIDQHDHASGQGVQITPAGLNINSDLTINDNNLTTIRTLRFLSQASTPVGVSDLGCLYEGGVDLYYIDGAGNNIRLTQSGSIVGTAGSISGLVPPASASYNAISGTFVWQSNTNVAANLDARSIILRTSTVSSPGLTLSPPSPVPTDYSITLPTLPASTSYLVINSSGAMSTTTASYGASLSSGAYSATPTPTPALVTNLSVTLTTSGRPVEIKLQSDGSTNSYIGLSAIGGQSNLIAQLQIYRDGSAISGYEIQIDLASNIGDVEYPSSCLSFVDMAASAGSHTYEIYALALTSHTAINVNNSMLLVREL